jgi:FAD/FMN-containing dehydrogenase
MDVDVIVQALGELQEFLADRATGAAMHRMAYSRDWSPRPRSHADLPDIVVVPHSTDEVQRIVQVALKHRLPIVPFAGGTGMGGGATAWRGGILVETKGLNRILELDEKSQFVRVGTGMTVWSLNEALAPHGLWFPHQPESKRACTIGACIGCDNDSTFGVRYGKILELLSDLVLVTGSGDAVRLGHRKASFTSTGYKLKDLVVGAEGTLGIVTEATLRVLPAPAKREVRGYLLRSLDAGAQAVQRILAAGVTLDSAHMNDRSRLHFYTHSYRETHHREPEVPAWAEALLFLSWAGDEDAVEWSRQKSEAILLGEFGAERVREQEIVEGWWDSKHRLEFIPFKQKWPDSQRQKKFGAADLGLPIGRLDEGNRRFREIAQANGLEILGMTVYNEAPNQSTASISFAVFVDDSTDESVARFYRYVKEMGEMAIKLEGTMSSYIGDGDRLGGLNALEHGAGLEIMRRAKDLFDPQGIMNPGKKFESRWIR